VGDSSTWICKRCSVDHVFGSGHLAQAHVTWSQYPILVLTSVSGSGKSTRLQVSMQWKSRARLL
jgi:hypothetical protein